MTPRRRTGVPDPAIDEKLFIECVPVFINVRDRLNYLKLLLGWLDWAGYRNITLIDNGSTYPPIVEFLNACRHNTIRLRKNLGHTVLWRLPQLREILASQWFVYSDPDVVPGEHCPPNVVVLLYRLLRQFPLYLKAGLGLRLDDIPDHYHLKGKLIEWEESLYGRQIAPDVFQADLDTTFALHRPRTPYAIGPAMRLRGIYEARHLPWYANSAQPEEEELYYRSHTKRGITTWNTSGDLRPSRHPGPGGIAARMDVNPEGVLNEILQSKSGRMMLALQPLRRLVGKSVGCWKTNTNITPSQARDSIMELMFSDEWQAAWSLAEPWRRLQAKFY